MLSHEKALSLYDEISDLLSSEIIPKEKLVRLHRIFKDIFIDLTSGSEIYFSNTFSRFVYISDRLNFSQDLKKRLNKFRSLSASALSGIKSKRKPFLITDDHIIFACSVVTDLVEAVSGDSPPFQLSFSAVKEYEELYDQKSAGEHIPLLKGVVTAKGDFVKPSHDKPGYAELICSFYDGSQASVTLYPPWNEIWKMVWKGCLINFINLMPHHSNNDRYFTANNSFCVLEPDILIDATEIAECFHSKGVNVYLYFLKKFTSSSSGFPLILGNIVNSVFDELIINPETDFNSAFLNALKYKPLQIFSLLRKDINGVKALRPALANQFLALKKAISKFQGMRLSVEPTFISAVYGLQGRLDVLAESDESILLKDVVELKSGSAPSANLVFWDGNTPLSVGVWNNHLAQITAYNLLLDSTFPGRTGTAEILYSKDENNPLRNAPNILSKKKEIISLRNWIIALEKQLIKDNFSVLSAIQPSSFRNSPSYVMDEVADFYRTYSSLCEIEKEYFHTFAGFIQREIYAQKAGENSNGSSSGFASLWKDSLEEKINSYSLLFGLKLVFDMSSFDSFHLYFSMPKDSSIGVFRKGDLVALYPLSEDGEPKPLSQQMIKGVIKEIDNAHIIISLRNKMMNKDIFLADTLWIAEPDFIESNNKKLFKSLYSFISGNKKNLILGSIAPEFESVSFDINYPGLTEEQRELISKAVSAKDYFIIQGPPGCGKTSYLLKNIVRFLYDNSSSNMLVMAYTNRASDEICSALKSIAFDFPLMRIGSKDNSGHEDIHLSHLSDKIRLKELHERFIASRVIVSTVSTLMASPELFESKDFDVAIVDEASQILEPQIVGILSNVKRFIMIGDEKQLPAVVCQTVKPVNMPSKDATLPSGTALSINEAPKQSEINVAMTCVDEPLFNTSISLFERLLNVCKANSWDYAYGMLTKQARMHADIMHFANKLFYNGKLELIQNKGWQSEGVKLFKSSGDVYEKILANNRVLFINTNREHHSKVNKQEAMIVSQFALAVKKAYGDAFDSSTLGVVSPFRAQCAAIKAVMPSDFSSCVAIDTVERFQGSERDIIIISFGVNYSSNLDNIQSLAYVEGVLIDRKLNVAMTRAKKHLILLGSDNLLSLSPIFSSLIDHIKERGGFFDSSALPLLP